ncbi:hypothetical protein H5410_023720 [Solanum commersonii]|uniref:Uncharacterized protein n=1 Tax=Solanum commersonii TaxID=4109 RepID=A0A9J5ZJE9_SOLCO|nr:hypothetical protein H5410_023720 [Solanum commersonii]
MAYPGIESNLGRVPESIKVQQNSLISLSFRFLLTLNFHSSLVLTAAMLASCILRHTFILNGYLSPFDWYPYWCLIHQSLVGILALKPAKLLGHELSIYF